MIDSPTWEPVLHLRRVTILSSPLYDIIYKELSQCASCDVYNYTLTSFTCQPSVDGYFSGSGGGPEASVTLPRYGS